MSRRRFKIVLLGEGRVGKTSIVVRFVRGKYDAHAPSTLQASFLKKQLTVGDEPVTLNIWDTAGQERFHALGPIYYRDADGALLVYDITYADSLERVKEWVKELRKMNRDIPIAIAGNKIDLEKDRHVPVSEAVSYAKSIGAIHMHTSAKLNKGLDDIFQKLAAKCIKGGCAKAGKGGRPSLVIVDDDPDNAPKRGCCGGGG